ncbi:MAG: hypothetical protein HZB76_00645 [Chlamydiae bacterium]|nr:hypothetical protein [Chlamydiota bacterium]
MFKFVSFIVAIAYMFNMSADLGSKKPIDVLLLLALPASGKSEVRKFLNSYSKEDCLNNFKIKEMIELDDFPFVHLMRRISDEETKRGIEGTFFLAPNVTFRNAKDWGTLIYLLNEDYEDLISQHVPQALSAGEWILERFDNAREKLKIEPVFKNMDKNLRSEIAKAIEPDAQKVLQEKIDFVNKGFEGKTLVIEFSRGGAADSTFPLISPYGYQFAFSLLHPKILEKASILYIWVTAEESRRKNYERRDPANPGSSLAHSVPLAVMYSEYGCDDIDYLLTISDRPNSIKVESHGTVYYLPCARLDNRQDKTTFVRSKDWKKEDIEALHLELEKAVSNL